MDTSEELLTVMNKMWTKLQNLPQASSLELGAFFVLILFVGKFQLLSLTHTFYSSVYLLVYF